MTKSKFKSEGVHDKLKTINFQIRNLKEAGCQISLEPSAMGYEQKESSL